MVSRETVPLLQAVNVSRFYGATRALHEMSLRLDRGQIVTLLGPSGSGKSTLLRCVAGLERPDGGRILLDGEDITNRPPHLRGFGMMFQQFALFPHRTVSQNVAFGLRMQGAGRQVQERRVAEMLDLVGLSGYGARSIFELSGGEQQRVALARSLAPSPPLLMLDEPLGSLDRSLRERLVDELRLILKEIGMTTLYVTHDQQEAFAISDRMILMNRGEKVQEGAPETLYRQPASQFAADFFGLQNHVAVTGVTMLGDSEWEAETSLGRLRFVTRAEPSRVLLLRPEAAALAEGQELNIIEGVVCERSFRGGHYRLGTRHNGEIHLEWEITTPDHDLPAIGSPIRLSLRPDAMTFLADSPD